MKARRHNTETTGWGLGQLVQAGGRQERDVLRESHRAALGALGVAFGYISSPILEGFVLCCVLLCFVLYVLFCFVETISV